MEGQGGGGSGSNTSSDFVRKLYKMLENGADESVVRWGDDGDSFVVLENEKFTKHILPKHFKHSNFASFVRQLNKYDFHKVRHNNEENGQSPYGQGAWEFKHPDFKKNMKDQLDNIRRKAPAPRKANQPEEVVPQSQQLDLINSQLMASQQQYETLRQSHEHLAVNHSIMVQELIGLQKTIVNYEQVMQNVMSFLHTIDAARRRDSRLTSNPFGTTQNGATDSAQQLPPSEDEPASPLQHASKILESTHNDMLLNPRNLELMNEANMRLHGTVTPPNLGLLPGTRPSSRGLPHPQSAGSTASLHFSDLDGVVYPVGHTNGIDPAFAEHAHNIPYPLPPKPIDPAVQQQPIPDTRKKSTAFDPGWIRKPNILLVEDDETCRRIGSKFLSAFHCSIEQSLDGLEAVHKMQSGLKPDLILMDIIMPNLDGVSACHVIRQFDHTPVIAMTSNIRSDDISMYFQHGMNDVLPKPFTKEGLLAMLEKHLPHLKRNYHGDPMVPPPVQSLQNSARGPSLKDEDSPAKSPATTNTWNSPSQIGVSPVATSISDDYSTISNQPGPFMNNPLAVNPTMAPPSALGVGASTMPPGMAYGNPPPPGMLGGRPPQQSLPPMVPGHRRQISEISGGDEPSPSAKRYQAGPPQGLPQGMQRPMQQPMPQPGPPMGPAQGLGPGQRTALGR